MANKTRTLAFLALIISACHDGASVTTPRYSAAPSSPFTLNIDSATTAPGDTVKLVALMNGKPAKGATLKWTSADVSVATVADGNAIAISDGEAVITASLGANRATAQITVRSPIGVVLMIGDGMGTGAIDAARMRAGTLFLESLPVHGWQSTDCSDCVGRATESASAATTLATGVRTKYGYLGVGPNGERLETILEQAERLGLSTGLVATSSVTHATPAAFASHLTDRANQNEIARQITISGVDVLLGGGTQWFTPTMRSTLAANGQLIGLFFPDSMPRLFFGDTPRVPSLADMSVQALDVLTKNRKGFFLMVEGSMIDWAGHNNKNEWLINETLDFDNAVRAVADKLGSRGNTLLIVTADHETGGLSVVNGQLHWTTTGHTAALVPVFSRGVGSERLNGTVRNDEIGQLMKSLIR